MRGRGRVARFSGPACPAGPRHRVASHDVPTSELRRRCRRALFAAARPHWRGSRRVLRGAVRVFLRRHHRDREQLQRALRSVARHSALALLLLGLAGGARADFAPRERRNPLPHRSVIEWSAPTLVDLDADGDLDVVSGGYYLAYLENAGSASIPAFLRRTGSRDPLDGLLPGYRTATSFGDVDGDGDLDLVSGADAGTGCGSFCYYENTGSAASPAFVQRDGMFNPFSGSYSGDEQAPALVDLDADGDVDLVSGDYSGGLFYYENTGTSLLPPYILFETRSGSQNPFSGIGASGNSAPALVDLDGDGDLDLLLGDYDGTFGYYENTGSASAPAFAARTGSQNPLAGVDLGRVSKPTLGDVDGDGDLDLVSGERDTGHFFYFENTGSPTAPGFVQRTGTETPLQTFDVGIYSFVDFADLDGDGDLDGLSQVYFENLGTASAPAFVERTGTQNPLDGIGGDLRPIDWEGDGDVDLVMGTRFFENTGSATSPAFVERTGTQNPLAALPTLEPAFADLDGDGDLDLVGGPGDGTFRYFENTGSATSPAFVERTGTQNPLDGIDVGAYVIRQALGDVDGDGDFDLIAGGLPGAPSYLENTGSATSPAFVERTGSQSPIAGIGAGELTTPALADIDGDGSPELFTGRSNGTFGFFDQPRGIALPIPWWAALGAALGVAVAARRTVGRSRAESNSKAAD